MKTPLAPKAVARNLRAAEAIHHAITVITVLNQEYWSQSLPELLEEMNTDVAETIEKFEGNYKLAVALNAAQDRLGVEDEHGNPVFFARAPLTRGRTDIVFQDGQFVHVPPAAPVEPDESSPDV